MLDIVDRLRNTAALPTGLYAEADEITKLRGAGSSREKRSPRMQTFIVQRYARGSKKPRMVIWPNTWVWCFHGKKRQHVKETKWLDDTQTTPKTSEKRAYT